MFNLKIMKTRRGSEGCIPIPEGFRGGGGYLFFKVSQNQPMDRSHGSETSAKIIMMTITVPNTY